MEEKERLLQAAPSPPSSLQASPSPEPPSTEQPRLRHLRPGRAPATDPRVFHGMLQAIPAAASAPRFSSSTGWELPAPRQGLSTRVGSEPAPGKAAQGRGSRGRALSSTESGGIWNSSQGRAVGGGWGGRGLCPGCCEILPPSILSQRAGHANTTFPGCPLRGRGRKGSMKNLKAGVLK